MFIHMCAKREREREREVSFHIQPIAFGVSLNLSHMSQFVSHMSQFVGHVSQPIAFGVSFNHPILHSQSKWSLFNGTWQKRPIELAKETNRTWQKRHIQLAKETKRTGNRDL